MRTCETKRTLYRLSLRLWFLPRLRYSLRSHWWRNLLGSTHSRQCSPPPLPSLLRPIDAVWSTHLNRLWSNTQRRKGARKSLQQQGGGQIVPENCRALPSPGHVGLVNIFLHVPIRLNATCQGWMGIVVLPSGNWNQAWLSLTDRAEWP